jgi:hypothetical protein
MYPSATRPCTSAVATGDLQADLLQFKQRTSLSTAFRVLVEQGDRYRSRVGRQAHTDDCDGQNANAVGNRADE